MFSRNVKTGVFILEGLNSFAVTFYFFYFYFFTSVKFGFGNKANLIVAAASGLVCVPGSIYGGRFAQHHGYFNALKIGFIVMMVALTAGFFFVDFAGAQIGLLLFAAAGMCFTWAPLEGMIAEGETYVGLQRNIGIYNVVWASAGAVAYFSGGAMLDKLGLKSLFVLPVAIQIAQLALTIGLERATKQSNRFFSAKTEHATPPHPQSSARAKAFLRMAWLANPFSYVASNTLIAVMPGVAHRLGLSTTLAGFCGSVWCFSRVGAFFALWFWPAWHYKFRWLLAAYLAFIVTFAAILMWPNLAVIVAAQIIFGLALGLIYYSSLFYSMDVGDTKGEHGGIHEATISLGNCIGPAVGAAALQFLPQFANSGAASVTILLLAGLGGLLGTWRTTKT